MSKGGAKAMIRGIQPKDICSGQTSALAPQTWSSWCYWLVGGGCPSVLEAKFALVRQHLHRCRPCTGRWPDQAFGLPLCTGAGLRPAHAPCAGPGLRPAHAPCAGPSPGLPMPLRRGRPPARPALGRWVPARWPVPSTEGGASLKLEGQACPIEKATLYCMM